MWLIIVCGAHSYPNVVGWVGVAIGWECVCVVLPALLLVSVFGVNCISAEHMIITLLVASLFVPLKESVVVG